MRSEPFISVVVPVRNGGALLGRCLDALLASCAGVGSEVVVVDDASTDGSATLAEAREGVRVLRLAERSGPAAARNTGARAARGRVLLFVDADVLVRPETVARVAACFEARPEIAAVFGSYDDDPAEKTLVSRYKNLLHHFTHQQGRAEAETFWAGCGAVRREAFERADGFDEKLYARPSIEDIELGRRLRRQGCRILLDKELQVKHLKRWTLRSLLAADIFDRAVPWSRLMFESGELASDLNLRARERVSAVLVALLCVSLICAFFWPTALVPAALLLSSVTLLNRKLYQLFYRRGGLLFLAGAFTLHLLYYFYSSSTFVLCRLAHALGRRGKAARLTNRAEA